MKNREKTREKHANVKSRDFLKIYVKGRFPLKSQNCANIRTKRVYVKAEQKKPDTTLI